MNRLRPLPSLLLNLALCLSLLACRPNEPFVSDNILRDVAADPHSPITFDEGTGEFQLAFHTVVNDTPVERNYILQFSPHTGQPLPSKSPKRIAKPSPEEASRIRENLKRARTFAEVQAALGVSEHILLELAADPRSPIEFDERVCEFHLVYDTVLNDRPMRLSNVWRFSPFTGQPLPSRLSELFRKPSPEEVGMITEKLKGLRTFAEVQAALGPPDVTMLREEVKFLPMNARASYHYTNIAVTLVLIVSEHDDGSFEWTYYAQRKP